MLTPTRVRFDALAVDRPMALLERRRVIGEKAMISHITLFKGCVVPLHRHENEQFSIVLSGELRFTFVEPGAPVPAGLESITLRAGEVLHLPSDLPHAAEAIEDTIVIDVFSPPSAVTGIDRR